MIGWQTVADYSPQFVLPVQQTFASQVIATRMQQIERYEARFAAPE